MFYIYDHQNLISISIILFLITSKLCPYKKEEGGRLFDFFLSSFRFLPFILLLFILILFDLLSYILLLSFLHVLSYRANSKHGLISLVLYKIESYVHLTQTIKDNEYLIKIGKPLVEPVFLFFFFPVRLENNDYT